MNDKEREARFSASVWGMVIGGAILFSVVVAFVAGFLLGHFTGHTKTTTVAVTEPSGESTTSPEQAEAESREAEAKEKAEAEAKEEAESKEEAEAEAEAEKKKEKESSAGSAGVEEGKQVFTASGCASCHTLAAAGASGTIGPDLDKALPGKSAAFIRESIVEPDAYIPPGYAAGIMPTTFKASLSSSELEALITFLMQKAGQ